jgi:hypothetical protein
MPGKTILWIYVAIGIKNIERDFYFQSLSEFPVQEFTNIKLVCTWRIKK